MAGPDYILEISSLKPQPTEIDATDGRFKGRPWLAVHWRCCNVYNRVYRNRQGDTYQGQCPKCSRRVNVRVGPNGTNSRFFEAS
jgi:hypothetical protein